MIMKSLELKVPELQELLQKLEIIKNELQAENQKTQTNNEWLNSDQIAKILQVSKRTLQNYRDRNSIPFAQVGRKIYYRTSDVQEYLESHHIKASYQKGGVS